jgi:alpha-tubulin suppressor-like RCC1 family protein
MEIKMIKKFNRFHKTALLLATLSLLAACGSKSSPAPLTVPDSETIFFAHNLVFRNSTTLSTGYNGFGQLGTGDLGNRTVPGYLNQHYPFKGVATGGNFSVAFFNNSTVRSWGRNAVGQLGIGSATTHSIVPVKTGGLSGVKAVAAGGFHALALKNDDTLWAWGSNELLQLGVQKIGSTEGPAEYKTLPVRVGSGFAFFSNISSISAGGRFSLARAGGSVWAWGDNGKGQIGLDPGLTHAMATPVNVNGLFPGGVAGIAAGGATSYAVARDGSLWAWGSNELGQLGNNSKVDSFAPVKVQKEGGGDLTGVVQVSAGLQHALARCADGTVWAWGYNLFGQLGNNGLIVNNLHKDSLVAVKVDLDTSVSKAADIRAFGSSSMAMVGNAWYVWGDNSYGQIGTGFTGTINLPVKMSGF